MYSYLVTSAILAVLLNVIFRWPRAPKIPTINAYPGDFTEKKAREAFLSDAKTLLAEGSRKVSST